MTIEPSDLATPGSAAADPASPQDGSPRTAPAASDAESGALTEPVRPAPMEPVLDVIQPHPGEAVPWPPKPDQRGLAAPYPPGGSDPDPADGLREERYYMRLLIAMVLVIVIGGFVIGIIGLILGFTGSAG